MRPRLSASPGIEARRRSRRWRQALIVLAFAAMVLLHALSHSSSSKHHHRNKSKRKNRRLVLLAGPEHAASVSVMRFFRKYSKKRMIHDWTYVDCPPDACPNLNLGDHRGHEDHREWSHLSSSDEQLVEEMLTRIAAVWDATDDHVLLGTPQFSLPIVQRIVKRLQAPRVTIVLNYRTPRIDQWRSVWTAASAQSYADFVCSARAVAPLDVSMNVMAVAARYAKQKYETAVMDMASIAARGLDISHTIGCDVLNVKCDDGWIGGLKDETMWDNRHEHREFGLGASQLRHMEQIFWQRDCAYRDDVVTIVPAPNGTDFWSNCTDNANLQTSLQDTHLVLNALRSQVHCETEEIVVETIPAHGSSQHQHGVWTIVVLGAVLLSIVVLAWRYQRQTDTLRHPRRHGSNNNRGVEMKSLVVNGLRIV